MTKKENKYDLEERTAQFGESIIQLCKSLKIDIVSKPLVSQCVRSGTSIGANYMEANGASSKRDFKNKIHICKKESKETQYWLQMLAKAYPDKRAQIKTTWQEAKELSMIFSTIAKSSK